MSFEDWWVEFVGRPPVREESRAFQLARAAWETRRAAALDVNTAAVVEDAWRSAAQEASS